MAAMNAVSASKFKTRGNQMGTPVVRGHPSYEMVSCMKMALSKSILSISMPEKARPLDPKKDFTIKTKVQFVVPSMVSDECDGGDSWNCCGGSNVAERRSTFDTTAAQQTELEGTGGGSTSSADHQLGSASGNPTTLHNTEFVFTDYSPMCYCHIRAFLKVDWQTLHEELCDGVWCTTPTPGKSSALLYFCGTKWVVKTMSSGESKFLRRILHRYYYHVKNNSHTLLPHFVGHHSITLQRGAGGGGRSAMHQRRKVTFIIMRNVFETPHVMSEKYDLKGSTIGRYASPKERAKVSVTLKDLDVCRHICVGEARREILLQQVRRDCDFLHKAGIMDYSFLLGVYHVGTNTLSGGPHNQPAGTTATSSAVGVAGYTSVPLMVSPQQHHMRYSDERCFKCDDGGMLSEPMKGCRHDEEGGGEIYYVGIIDILQEYTTWKWAENIVRGLQYDRDKISSVPPKQYAQRFIRFLSSIVI